VVIDTSAMLAVLLGEPEAPPFIRAIADDPRRLISVMSALEASIVLSSRKGPSGNLELDLFLHAADVQIVSFDRDQLEMARSAYQRFGKGRHRAALNLGDCCTYALARTSGEALLFKGEDFLHTDLRFCPASP
jgi:ribonuclease VapC